MVPMTQRGAWWKGLTDKNVEVAISDDFFKDICERQMATHDFMVLTGQKSRALEVYGVALACYSPQWWVDVFRDHRDGVGLQKHTWVKKKNYAKVMLGEVTCPGHNSYNLMGTEGTLIFRTLSDKMAQRTRIDRISRTLRAAQQSVDDFFNKRSSIVRW